MVVTTAVATDTLPVRAGRPLGAGPLAEPLPAAALALPRAALEGGSGGEGPWLVTAVATTVVIRPADSLQAVTQEYSTSAYS